MKTLKQLVKKFQSLAESHLQIKGFDFTTKAEAFHTKTSFPFLLIEILPGTISDKDLIFSFSFFFSDRVSKGLDNYLEVLSDQAQIALDYRAMILNDARENGYSISNDITITPFQDSTDEETAGWMFEMDIKLSDLKDICQVPI